MQGSSRGQLMNRWAQAKSCTRLSKCLNSGSALAGRRWLIGCQLWLRQTRCALKSSRPGRTFWSAPCERWALAAKQLHRTLYRPLISLGFRSCHLVQVQQRVEVRASACLSLHVVCPAVACMVHQLLLDGASSHLRLIPSAMPETSCRIAQSWGILTHQHHALPLP